MSWSLDALILQHETKHEIENDHQNMNNTWVLKSKLTKIHLTLQKPFWQTQHFNGDVSELCGVSFQSYWGGGASLAVKHIILSLNDPGPPPAQL